MAFLETPRFPDCIAVGATGGPGFSTDVVTLNSGFEQRNANWSRGRGMWDVGHAARSPENMMLLIEFFRAVKARHAGFRFKDHADFAALQTNAILGSGLGDGTTTVFQLRKVYAAGALSDTRDIRKPVASTIKIYKAGVLQTSGYTLDNTTGLITFTVAPTNGQTLTWEGEFDTPVRFDTDEMKVTLIDYKNYEWQSIPIIEIRV